MCKVVQVWAVVLVVLVVGVSVGAQDVAVVPAADGVLALSVGDVVAMVMGLLGLIAGVIAVVRTWASAPSEGRTVAGLDRGIAAQLDARARDRELMATVEKLVDSQNRAMQATLKEVGEVVLKAAMWQPSEAVRSGAHLLHEVTDGVPLAEKVPGFNPEPEPAPDDEYQTKPVPAYPDQPAT